MMLNAFVNGAIGNTPLSKPWIQLLCLGPFHAYQGVSWWVPQLWRIICLSFVQNYFDDSAPGTVRHIEVRQWIPTDNSISFDKSARSFGLPEFLPFRFTSTVKHPSSVKLRPPIVSMHEHAKSWISLLLYEHMVNKATAGTAPSLGHTLVPELKAHQRHASHSLRCSKNTRHPRTVSSISLVIARIDTGLVRSSVPISAI
ncbi:hypothetical protein J3A83DRAFT_4237428 [Scleroderma citrinum]